MRHWIALLPLLLLISGLARAEVLLIAPSEPLQPGSAAALTVLFTNDSDTSHTVEIPQTLDYRLSSEKNVTDLQGTLKLAEERAGGVVTLAQGEFVKTAYTFTVPQRWTGFGRLALALPSDQSSNGTVALVEIARPGVQLAQSSQPDADEDASVIQTIETAVEEVYDPGDEPPFQAHEPMFFLYGLNPDEAKFQISFKYRLFHNIKDSSPLRFMQNMHVAYTQLSFWDFDSASKPFRDSSYKPELFFDIGDPVNPESPIIPGVGLRHVRLGVMHESNGQDGLASRSLNYAYVQPEFVFDFDRNDPSCNECEWWELSVQPRTWIYVGSTSDNPDIDDFRGHAQVKVRLMERNVRNQTGIGLAATLRKGDTHEKATLILDATTPFPFVQGLFTPNLHAQFFTGYSESLIGFDQKDTRFRVGFGTRW